MAVPHIAYRPDIDGLRAIAVMSVLLFHTIPGLAPAGFIGVDVFFVISGYLITGNIVRAAAAGKFSFADFYFRRAKRLFPAMFTVFGVSYFVGALLLSPAAFSEMSGSTFYAILSLSNFFFWMMTGYFDTDAALKPLLHTWSLSVEEQFYLLWPLTLLILLRFKSSWIPVAFLIAASVGSVAIAEYWMTFDDAAAFFLLPSRIVELAFGAILVWLIRYRPSAAWILDITLVVGLALIGYSIYFFTSNTPFPGVHALVPCLGAALCLYAGQARYAGVILRSALPVWIGRISYSLYLVHWPLIVFYGYYRIAPLTLVERVGIIGISILLAYLMFRFVERPFRETDPAKFSRSAFGFSCAMLAIVLILPSATTWADGGAAWRLPAATRNAMPDIEEARVYLYKNRDELLGKFSTTTLPKILVVGDSQAADFVNMLTEAGVAKDVEIRAVRLSPACQIVPPKYTDIAQSKIPASSRALCRKQHESLYVDRRIVDADVVVLASSLNSWAVPYVPETVRYLRSRTRATIVVLGPKNQSANIVDLIGRPFYRGLTSRADPNFFNFAKNMKEKTDAVVLDIYPTFCKKMDCQYMADGKLMFFDERHLTEAGAKFLGKHFVALGLWKALLGNREIASGLDG